MNLLFHNNCSEFVFFSREGWKTATRNALSDLGNLTAKVTCHLRLEEAASQVGFKTTYIPRNATVGI